MKARTVVIIAAGAATLAAIGAGIALLGEKPTRGIAREPQRQGSDATAEMAKEMRRLQNQLSQVEARLAAQGQTMSDLARTAPSAAAPGADGDNPQPVEETDPETVAAERAHQWEQKFEQEPLDPSWAKTAKSRLLDLVSTSFSSVVVQDLECRAKTCRFTARFDDGDPNRLGPGPWTSALSRLFPSLHVTRSNAFAGGVYYVTEGDEP